MDVQVAPRDRDLEGALLLIELAFRSGEFFDVDGIQLGSGAPC
jgi:hypothetical protein